MTSFPIPALDPRSTRHFIYCDSVWSIFRW